MTRTPIIGGNWKMHLDLGGAVQLASEVRNRLGSVRGVEVVLFPPFPFLDPVGHRLDGTAVALGSQDLSPHQSGAYTSGVSASMLVSVGCSHVLVGHSERRTVFGDDDDVVAAKLTTALAAGLTPVLCVGEQLRERESGDTFRVLDRQLQVALRGHPAANLEKLVIAYEPVWAIGTGLVASPAQAQQVHAYIRQKINDLYGPARADAVRIQYGGSVKASTAAGLMAEPDIDGLLVGGASLQADEFANIVRWRQSA